MKSRQLTLLLLTLIWIAGYKGARAQESVIEEPSALCDAIKDIVSNSDFIPRDRLDNGLSAVRCLVEIIKNLDINSVNDAAASKQLRRAAKGLRAIFDAEVYRPTGTIEEFRRIESLDVVSSLVFGARSDNTDARIESTLVLGDVADNKILCVLIDHLYDPNITVAGRFNILAALSSIPNYATELGARELKIMTSYFRPRLAERSDTFNSLGILSKLDDKTNSRLSQIRSRSPTDAQAMKQLEDSEDAFCSSYNVRWAGDRILGPPYTVFIHYRDDVTYSKGYIEPAEDLLRANGFLVGSPSAEGPNEQVLDIPGAGGEGPHVDYFPISDDELANQLAAEAADKAARLLNGNRPVQFSEIRTKPNPDVRRGNVRQGHFLGVWF